MNTEKDWIILKARVKYFILLFVPLIWQNNFASNLIQSSPLSPGNQQNETIYGITLGLGYPLSPAEMFKTPSSASTNVHANLLNGLDGLGYNFTYNVGFILKFPLNESFYIGSSLQFSQWSSSNKCNCLDNTAASQNTLSMAHTAISPQYYIYNGLFVFSEISFNIFFVDISEKSNRGTIEFSDLYPRFGSGLGLGYEYRLSESKSIELSVKAILPNLFLKNDNFFNHESEALITSNNSLKEANVILLFLNLSVTFK
ncbi:MAG: hypothetical protein NT007_01230 [Candidatus Kapabacteria bacterium]|nr:hypothetical protein [Candidatus Kapabacteria bacterium]